MSRSKRFIAVFRREIHRIKSYTAYMLVLTILPIISFVLLGTLFRKGSPDNLPIVVVDNDHSSLSRQLYGMIDATSEVEVRYQATDMLAAKRLIMEGRAHAILLIPDYFERDILNLTPSHLEAYISGSNILINGFVTKAFLSTITTFSTGIQLQTLTKQGIASEQAMSLAIPVQFDKHLLFNPYTNYSYYLSPSFMPMMILIFTTLATIFALGSELRYASASEWLTTADGSLFIALTGKLLPTLLMMIIMLFVMFYIQFEIIGVPMNGNFAILALGGVVFIISYMSISTALISLTADMRLALSLGGGYAVMAFSFSGLTFPLMAMYESMQIFSHLFPFSYFTDIIIDQAIRGAPASRSLYNICYMMLFWLLPLFTLRRLRHISTEPEYWGKL